MSCAMRSHQVEYSPVQSPNMSVPVTNMAVHWPIMGTQYLTQYEGGQTPDHISSLLSSRLLDFSGVNLPVDGRRSASIHYHSLHT